ncbi:MAG: hypothetical protein MPN21_24200 [Thermoanaerobaculia bacterium]|nr:hypothetical protein [Thermoanaerobaculia bacterium]
MAVYERSYRLWKGEPTPAWTRVLTIPRYVVRDVFRSRALLAYFVACFIFPVGCAAFIFMVNNAELLQTLFPGADVSDLVKVDGGFFLFVLRRQIWLSLFLAIFVGPGLVSRDLVNNGLPLILSRPFSRVQYVMGKMLVLCSLVGAVVWLAPVLLLALHVNYQGLSWVGENSRVVIGVLLAPWLWILAISIFALAMSAWVRWKAVAGFGMYCAVLAGYLLSEMIDGLFHTELAGMVNPILVVDRAMASLIGTESLSQMPAAASWMSLIVFMGLSLFLLERKLRAYQVVR